MLSFKPTFSQSSFTFIKRLFSSSSLSAITVVSVICISEVIDISPSNLDSSLCFIQPSVSHDVLNRVLLFAGAKARQRLDAYRPVGKAVAECLIMLLCQQGGGHQQCHLFAALYSDERRA